MITLDSDMNLHTSAQENQQKLLPPELHTLSMHQIVCRVCSEDEFSRRGSGSAEGPLLERY